MALAYNGDDSSLEPFLYDADPNPNEHGASPEDLAVAKATTLTALGGDFFSKNFECSDYKRNGKRVWAYLVGANAGSAGNVIVKFEISPNGGTDWFELTTQMSIALNGVAQVIDASAHDVLELQEVPMIRIKSIQNPDASYACTIQVYIIRR